MQKKDLYNTLQSENTGLKMGNWDRISVDYFLTLRILSGK